ncbi:MAG: RNA 2',3'-cyclic phosphodiesterase [Acidobacteria bacterium]|jgi:2'-5' RNA ligase|nr:RNA 2',3'-cyclic phosphodiesterase [Thermoanaerobaculia bacterium]MDI9630590.1 RNA 2',3'-cyclic phosphodiesterase [Acidobacteriota bacterium]OQC41716.1 MAG: 2'-5'-RNA ligase [Acidobacteria bacterium ADurb.Bin051]MBP7813706.1 RNA 2',3'-cyclic phosphodiesterase [Thermoanaerobaculia bacterium]MBP8844825.1 RNA 2',3'-cyclic phosphodiesterase [Thermoanaerobaculia bacterium]
MRLFVAVAIPEAHRQRLGERLRALGPASPRARWERAEKLHLTLRFLGEVAPQRLPELEAALAGATASASPLTVRLTAGGAFPPAGRARVLWVGAEPEAGLVTLQQAVATAVAPFAEREEGRPFRPHLTLARCDPPWEAREVARFVSELGTPAPEPFPVTACQLVESRLGPGGARHTGIASFPLGGEGESRAERGEERR